MCNIKGIKISQITPVSLTEAVIKLVININSNTEMMHAKYIRILQLKKLAENINTH